MKWRDGTPWCRPKGTAAAGAVLPSERERHHMAAAPTLMLWPLALMMAHTAASRPILSWQEMESVLTVSLMYSSTAGREGGGVHKGPNKRLRMHTRSACKQCYACGAECCRMPVQGTDKGWGVTTRGQLPPASHSAVHRTGPAQQPARLQHPTLAPALPPATHSPPDCLPPARAAPRAAGHAHTAGVSARVRMP